MTAHVLVPSLDEERPATLSPKIVQAILRDELGYAGVILSDDLEMKAIAAIVSVPEAAVQAIAAGCDGLLICSGDVEVQAVTLEALVHAVEDGRIRTSGSKTRLSVCGRRKSGSSPRRSEQAARRGCSTCWAAMRISASQRRCPASCEPPSPTRPETRRPDRRCVAGKRFRSRGVRRWCCGAAAGSGSFPSTTRLCLRARPGTGRHR